MSAKIDKAAEVALIKELQETSTVYARGCNKPRDDESATVSIKLLLQVMELCGEHEFMNDVAIPEVTGRILGAIKLHERYSEDSCAELENSKLPFVDVFRETVNRDVARDERLYDILVAGEKLASFLEDQEFDADSFREKLVNSGSVEKFADEIAKLGDSRIYGLVRSLETIMLSQQALALTMRLSSIVVADEARHTKEKALRQVRYGMEASMSKYLENHTLLNDVKDQMKRQILRNEIGAEQDEAKAENNDSKGDKK